MTNERTAGQYRAMPAQRPKAERTNDAINLLEHVLAECERILGNEHPDTRAVRGALSQWR